MHAQRLDKAGCLSLGSVRGCCSCTSACLHACESKCTRDSVYALHMTRTQTNNSTKKQQFYDDDDSDDDAVK